MFDARRRPMGRLSYWWITLAMIAGAGLNAWGAAAAPQSGPGSTTVADTVYMADGSIAQGALIITWPAFVTASGSAVAGGATTVTLGTNGALSVPLVPNAGATPGNVYYTVVYQLGPAQTTLRSTGEMGIPTLRKPRRVGHPAWNANQVPQNRRDPGHVELRYST